MRLTRVACHRMFQKQRAIMVEQLTKRFKLDSTPDRHTLLALKMNPQIDTSPEGPLLMHKQAMREMMDAEYKRALRRQAMLQEQRTTRTATRVVPAPLAAPITPAPLTGLSLTATEMAATETPVLTTPTVRMTGLPVPPSNYDLSSVLDPRRA